VSHGHGHSHGHPHDHDHAHDHDHSHADQYPPHPATNEAPETATNEALERAAQAHRAPVEEGAGKGKVLFFDAFSGIAGDMTIAALVDLGVPFDVVRRAVTALGLSGTDLLLKPAQAGAIGATKFDVVVRGAQPQRSLRDIEALLIAAPLDDRVRASALAIFRTLGAAEAEVHRTPVEAVHFHEVGAVDALVDIVGAAACVTYLDAKIVCTPLPMGRGFVTCAHGRLPLPAPGAVACLKGVPTYDAGIEAELVTPTGAAIIRTIAGDFSRWPSLAVERIGWGAGTMALADRPNALRVVLGTGAPQSAGRAESETHTIIEANVDDMTGELAAYAIDALLAAGTLDAWATPLTMKKGRPGLMLSALCVATDGDRIAEIMLRETSTLGVRRRDVARIERPRRVETVETRFGEIRIKIGGGPYGAEQVKPEFEDCARAARAAGVPLREVIQEALRVALSR
jgi:uncharacterized protein (TIGR00299 family) protein